MTVLRLGMRAWLIGLLAYIAALGILYGEWMISPGDLGAVVFSSLIVFWICYWLVYLPVLRLARRAAPRAWASWMYPVLGVLLGALPTAAIARYWSGSFRGLLTPEALLFFILFTAVGLVVGVGFGRIDPA
ncbi:MAG: hypothetical protein FJ207_03410 [Gemmatimonadetes bacterium]|nr:hypothetical protein [Gemmatimonadota bacterium]